MTKKKKKKTAKKTAKKKTAKKTPRKKTAKRKAPSKPKVVEKRSRNLYTWDFHDGFTNVKRQLNLGELDTSLLKRAYLAGGPGWASAWGKPVKVKPETVLCLILNSTATPEQQSDDAYEYLFDHYDTEAAWKKFKTRPQNLSGLEQACWQFEFRMGNRRVEAIMKPVLEWHHKHIRALHRKMGRI